MALNSSAFCLGGTLELAQGGVAYFPSIELLKRKDLASLIYALETTSAGALKISKYTEGVTKSPEEESIYSTTASVWATCELNPITVALKSHEQSAEDDAFSTTDNPIQLPVELLPRRSGLQKAISTFDIVVNTDLVQGPSEITDRLIVDMCLSHSLGLKPDGSIETSGSENATAIILSSVFDACSTMGKIPVPHHVSRLLQVYYLAIRRACSVDRYPVPCSALNTLFKLTKSNAKLNGRSSVVEVDALIAVYLYDTFIQSLTGE
ncbi:unnamed protein product [Echinostoma caproni]|uniref:VPS9 domain-containing protein n=1 Tax=Echinostoma caproni TaxID=27848 RepID=A0A183AIE5_9TREM|nr:unnamed protein product [Echinostoma caproni]